MLQKACGRRPNLCIPDNPAKLLLHLAPSDVVGILRWRLQGKLECFSRANRVAAIRTERRWHLASQQHSSEEPQCPRRTFPFPSDPFPPLHPDPLSTHFSLL